MSQDTNLISRSDASQISKEIMEAVRPILAKHGVNLDGVSSKYGDLFKITITGTATKLGKNGVNLASKEAQDLINHAYLLGLTTEQAQDLLGEPIVDTPSTGECILIGYAPRKRDLNLIVKNMATGKQYFVRSSALLKMAASK